MRRVSPATVTFGVLAILFGLATAYAVRQYLKPPAPAPAKPAPQPQMAEVVVAAVNLPAYTRIQEPFIKLVRVPADQVPPGAIRTTGRALFRVVKKTILADQPLLEEHLYGIGELPKLADRLPPGYRAVTLPIGGPAALSGMIQPESRIDILLTYQDDTLPEHRGPVTMTLLRNVLVLATSVAAFPRAEDRRTNVQDITVAVTPEQANRLILAQKYGSLSAVLCGQEEGQAGKVAEGEEKYLVDRYALLGIERPKPPEPVEPEPLPPEPVVVEHRVEVWKGGSRHEVVFGEEQILEALNATAVSEGREPMKALPISLPGGASTQPIPTRKPCKSCGKRSRGTLGSGGGTGGESARELMEAIRAAEEAARRQGRTGPTPAAKPASHESGRIQGRSSVEVQVEAIQTSQ